MELQCVRQEFAGTCKIEKGADDIDSLFDLNAGVLADRQAQSVKKKVAPFPGSPSAQTRPP